MHLHNRPSTSTRHLLCCLLRAMEHQTLNLRTTSFYHSEMRPKDWMNFPSLHKLSQALKESLRPSMQGVFSYQVFCLRFQYLLDKLRHMPGTTYTPKALQMLFCQRHLKFSLVSQSELIQLLVLVESLIQT